VPPRHVNELAAAIAALAGDPARRKAMGRAGRALVEREFDENKVARETLAVYDAALRGRAPQQ
jgi:glycosyltransferase involved in cell wall biosynthesis